MKHTNKKGFTIVELVIVIAVIAILAAVLIPTFSNLIKKANQSSDIQLIRNLNNAVAAAAKENITIAEAIAAAATFDIAVDDIEAKAKGNKILWDDVAKVFCYLNGDTVEYISNVATAGTGVDLWIIDTDGDNETDATYSSYVLGVAEGATINAKNGIDVTGCAIVTINYTGDKAVKIYTKAGDTLVVDNPTATVYHYGVAEKVVLKAVADNSYHLNASVVVLEAWDGRIVPESGVVKVLIITKGEGAAEDAKVIVALGEATIGQTLINNDVAGNYTDDEKTAIKNAVGAVEYKNADELASAEETIKATNFAAGTGTAEDPYIITNAAQLKLIGLKYEEGYAYYKVGDGVTEIDCSGWPKINLNGSFDGNGVTLNNLTYALFEEVGYKNKADNIVIKNLTANINTTAGTAFVRSVYNSGKTTFENITLRGTVEGKYNMGSFYNYGTANLGESDGANYEVAFVNAKSYLTLICTTGNAIGGMLGHGYEGADYTLSITMDENSGYFGKMYTTGTATCYEMMAMCSHATYVLNGKTVSRYDNTKPSTKLTVVKPVDEGETGWTVEKQEGVSYYVVSVHAQVDSYNAEGEMLKNSGGITMVLDSETVTDLNAVLLDKVTSVAIVNEYINNGLGYEIVDGVLKAYVGPRAAGSGTFRLQVTQYDADGNIVATGIEELGTVEYTPAN